MRLLLCALLFLVLCGCDKAASESNFYNGGGTGQGGSLARFTIAGNYLYTVDQTDLKVFDITDAANPIFKRVIPVGFEIETIFPFKDRLFIGSTSVVHIFSLADPSNPQKLSEAISPEVMRRCDPVVAKDTVAFATLRTNGPCGGVQSILAVYDIRNVARPVQRATYPLSEPYGLGYSDTVLYVCDNDRGLVVLDITKPFEPQFVKSLQDGSYIDVIPYGTTLICWVRNGMLLYDISDNKNPVLLTRIN